MEPSISRRLVAVVAALIAHGLFAVAVGALLVGLYTGLGTGLGPFHGTAAVLADLLLVASFPILHSLALTPRGRRLLARAAPARYARDLATTLFTGFASLQVAVLFALWSPSGITLFEASGWLRGVSTGLYAASWLLMIAALVDSGLAVQLGVAGWSAVWRGDRPRYGGMPEGGLYRFTRQPMYVAFALVMWAGPDVTLDRVLLAVPWTLYCVLGPLLRERRSLAMYGERFAAYRRRVPYWIPRRPRREQPIAGGQALGRRIVS